MSDLCTARFLSNVPSRLIARAYRVCSREGYWMTVLYGDGFTSYAKE